MEEDLCSVCEEVTVERTRSMMILAGCRPAHSMGGFTKDDLARLYALALRVWAARPCQDVCLPDSPAAKRMFLKLRRLG